MLQLVIMKFSVHLTFPKESVSLHGTVIGLAPLKKKKNSGSFTCDLRIWVSHMIYMPLMELDGIQSSQILIFPSLYTSGGFGPARNIIY